MDTKRDREVDPIVKESNGVGLDEKVKFPDNGIRMPDIQSFLPHIARGPYNLEPALKLAKNPRSQVSLILGIPTVKRDRQSYLHVTLKSLIDNMGEKEAELALIVVLVAETDRDFVTSVFNNVEKAFPKDIESGLIEMISPPLHLYPDWSKLRKTLGDEPERVQWRSKQNLDYAFLMMYSHSRGPFYVQLEDDVITTKGYITAMYDFAISRIAQKQPWFVIYYCELGFIGKMFKSSDLPKLIQFFLMFYNDKPGDWLMDSIIQTMVCEPDQEVKDCMKKKQQLRIPYNPSLFQHIGTHSSLQGKKQELKDKSFGMFVPHQNPLASVRSSIRHYKSFSITRAYNGNTFFWGHMPQAADSVVFQLMPPVKLTGYKFVSGSKEHPSDKFVDTLVEINMSQDNNRKVPASFDRKADGFITVGKFDVNGTAKGALDPNWGHISHVRLYVQTSSKYWVLLKEIHLKVEERSE